MMVELPYRPDSDYKDMSDDSATAEAVRHWKGLFASQDPEVMKERNALIIRHMAYARRDIEDLLCGSQLSLIELLELRRVTEESLLQTIALHEVKKDNADFMPTKEILIRFMDECMDIPLDMVHVCNRLKKGKEFREYLFRKHEEMHTL